MSNNAQKTHLAQSLNRFAENKVQDALQTLGKALPCKVVAVDGSIVTVSFLLASTFTLPQVTCPMFGPEYIRYPTQVGDLGVVLSADYYIGSVSGLGGGQAGLTLQSNLSTLIFFPIASTNWSQTDDPDAVVIYGPNGVVIRTKDDTGAIVVALNAINSKANLFKQTGNFEATGQIKSDGAMIAGNGATGTFTTADSKTVTVSHGIITSIV